MTRKRLAGKALAERRRRTFQLYLAEFTRRRSPRRSACTPPSFAAICNRPATYAAAGIPPILKWRTLSDGYPETGTGTLHVV